MKYWAEVIVYDDRNETVKVLQIKRGTITNLKHKLYNLAFLDFFGENAKALKQWKADNK